MLNFKNTSLIFVFIIAVLLVTNHFSQITFWPFLIISIIYLTILAYGSYSIEAGFYIPVKCSGDKTEKQVALSFDDGPAIKNTPLILDVLKKNNITATFFCIGNRIENHPDLAKRIVEEGHILGNHSFTHHFFFDLFTGNKMISEIEKTNEIAKASSGRKPKLFRPPYGVTTPVLAKAIKKTGVIPVGWSLRSFDTITSDKNNLISKIENQLKAGDIILLHDTKDVTLNALQEIIDLIHKKGMEIVSIDQLLNIPSYD